MTLLLGIELCMLGLCWAPYTSKIPTQVARKDLEARWFHTLGISAFGWLRQENHDFFFFLKQPRLYNDFLYKKRRGKRERKIILKI